MRERISSQLPDDDLVVIAQSPDDDRAAAAAEELLGRYRERVYLWAHRYARDRERAMDLAQDVLLSAWRALPTFERRAPFAAWLFTITRHRCIRAVRPVSLVRDDDVELSGLPDRAPTPDTVVEEQEAEDHLLDLIQKELEPHERQALVLRAFERMPVEEITRVLNLDGATGARGVLQTARRKLRAAMERTGMNPGGTT